MSTFTQKHYEKIAYTLRNCIPPTLEVDARRAHYGICVHMREMFRIDNEKFNQDKFMKACGWDQRS